LSPDPTKRRGPADARSPQPLGAKSENRDDLPIDMGGKAVAALIPDLDSRDSHAWRLVRPLSG
jgi:hypothetical protein